MKDMIALGFIVALIGATSAVAAAHGSHPVVASVTTAQSHAATIAMVGGNTLEPAGLYAAAGSEGY